MKSFISFIVLSIGVILFSSCNSDNKTVTKETHRSLSSEVDLSKMKAEAQAYFPALVEAFGFETVFDMMYDPDKTLASSDTNQTNGLSVCPHSSSNYYSLKPDSINKVSIGSAVNYGSEYYSEVSIFDFNLLNSGGYLQQHVQSPGGSSDETSISIKSKTVAENDANSESYKGSGSIAYEGFSARASVSFDSQKAHNESTSGVAVTVGYIDLGKENQILIPDDNVMVEYLSGEDINVSDFIVVERDKHKNISDIYITYGQNTFPSKLYEDVPIDNYYGFIKILSELQKNYVELSKNHSANETLLENLNDTIRHAIDNFYDCAGTHFVTTQELYRSAYGYGTLVKTSSSDQHQAGWGLSAATGYNSLAGGADAAFSYAQKASEGQSTAVQTIAVKASSSPSGTINTTDWANAVEANLNANIVSPPSSPALPPVPDAPTLPDKAGIPKKPIDQINGNTKVSTFQKNFDNLKNLLTKSEKKINQEGIKVEEDAEQTGVAEEIEEDDGSGVGPAELFSTTEINYFVTAQQERTLQETGYYTSSISSTEYSDVLPQLNFNLADAVSINPDFQNASELYMQALDLYNIAEYYTFILSSGILDDTTASVYNYLLRYISANDCKDNEYFCNVAGKFLATAKFSFNYVKDIDATTKNNILYTYYSMLLDDDPSLSDNNVSTPIRQEVRLFIHNVLKPGYKRVIKEGNGGYMPFALSKDLYVSNEGPHYEITIPVIKNDKSVELLGERSIISFDSDDVESKLLHVLIEKNTTPWFPFFTYKESSTTPLLYFFNVTNNKAYVMDQIDIHALNESLFAPNDSSFNLNDDYNGSDTGINYVTFNKNFRTLNLMQVIYNTDVYGDFKTYMLLASAKQGINPAHHAYIFKDTPNSSYCLQHNNGLYLAVCDDEHDDSRYINQTFYLKTDGSTTVIKPTGKPNYCLGIVGDIKDDSKVTLQTCNNTDMQNWKIAINEGKYHMTYASNTNFQMHCNSTHCAMHDDESISWALQDEAITEPNRDLYNEGYMIPIKGKSIPQMSKTSDFSADIIMKDAKPSIQGISSKFPKKLDF